MFLEQFSKYFSADERETELYNLWSSIGVNTEKAILEEQSKLNKEYTDINKFNEDTIRSWLSFFLMKIPYRTSAICRLTVEIDIEKSSSVQSIRIPKYAELSTTNGIVYTLMDEINLIRGSKRSVNVIQGTRIVESGTYNTLIRIQASNPDLSTLKVKINNIDIPEVSYQTSYDDLAHMGSWSPRNEETRSGEHSYGGTPFLRNGFGTKGYFYEVLEDGVNKFDEFGNDIEFKQGDILVYDGNQWVRNAYTNNLRPIQLSTAYGIPSNGYFAYYYDGYLYVKVFQGTEVDNPENCNYEITYIQSDGVQGEISSDDSLEFVSTYEDPDGNEVSFILSHNDSTNGVNEPSKGKLGLFLKQKLYSSTSVSSVPEYTNWFKAQPEVGDALVLSDYEMFKRKGESTFTPTGKVVAYLIGSDGVTPLSSETKIELLDRLEQYKDIGLVEIKEFQPVKNVLILTFTDCSTDTEQFKEFVKNTIRQFYNVDFIQSTNQSLFENLDLSQIIKEIQNDIYESSGLVLKGYHYYSTEKTVQECAGDITISTYQDELPGVGFYRINLLDSSKQLIRQYKLNEIEGTSKSSCTIAGSDEDGDTQSIYGTHNIDLTGGSVTLQNISNIINRHPETDSVKIECYWGMENEGILSVGLESGIRSLENIEVYRIDENNRF